MITALKILGVIAVALLIIYMAFVKALVDSYWPSDQEFRDAIEKERNRQERLKQFRADENQQQDDES